MKKFKKDIFIIKLPDVRSLMERGRKIDIRKGLQKIKKTGYVDLTEYKEQKLFNDEKV